MDIKTMHVIFFFMGIEDFGKSGNYGYINIVLFAISIAIL